MTSGRCCRAVRAATFAAVCVLLAAVGHILMSGAPVAPPALAAAFTATGLLAWAATGRERTAAAVTAATVAAQAVLHAAFSLAQTLAAPAAAAEGTLLSRWAGHLLCRPPAPPDPLVHHPAGTAHHHTPLAAAMPAGHDMAALSPTGMLAAHLLAALLCGLWLAYGERAAFRALRAVAGWLAAPLRLALHLSAPPATAAGPRRPRHRRTAARLRRLLLSCAHGTRGPPVGTAAVL
ncbi:hypothetical protein [Streptomyces sp. ODS05-4]|uniref:hypothetical protein n=1 Tax=Streptomyces sp. ODS05-4 TaxID=2944939 RepID=UPI00210A003F|nr:hypothetical protein [Streptomyces sp. ODS05-4]